METVEISRKIERGIPGSKAEVAGADAHYSAIVVAPAFEGKTRIERHQMVYATLRQEMTSQAVHALALKTLTPAEWEREQRKQER